MDRVRRVVIHDRSPVFDPAILAVPFNRLVMLAAVLALVAQVGALWEVLLGEGMVVGRFDHVGFAVVAFLWLLVGALVFFQRQGNRAGRCFLLASAAGSTFLALGTLYQVSLLNALVYVAGLLLFPPLLFSFARWADDTRSRRPGEALLYVPPLLLLWPSAAALANRHASTAWRIALVLVAAYLLGAIVQAWRDHDRARTPERAAQARALVAGLAAGTAPGILIFILPLVVTGNLTATTSWLPPLILLFLLAMSYAVLLYEFSEADLIVRRGIVYGALTLLIVLAYGALGVVLFISRASVTSPSGGLSFIAVSILVGAAFGPIRYAGRRAVDWMLYGQPIERWELLQALSSRLATVMQPGALGEVVVREIGESLHLRGAFLLRRVDAEPEGRGYAVCYPIGEAVRLQGLVPADAIQAALLDPPTTLLLRHAKPLTAGRREAVPQTFLALDALHVSLAIPLVTRAGNETILCLQPKLSHDAFDRDDLELLAPVIRQATAALDNALLFAALEEKIDELRAAYRRIAGEQEAERARLARELHDGTAQELAGLITLSAVAQRQLQGDRDGVRSTLDRMKRQAEDAYQDVRRASHALRPLMLDDFGLAPTLSRYLEGFTEATGIAVDFRLDDPGTLSDDVELALFRVAQECMENIRKHSGTRQAALSLFRQNGHVLLSVCDTGRGLPTGTSRGIGLAGMRERIEAVGGSIRVASGVGGGVVVEAVVPIGSPS
ncbi:MAG: sensor histidine kinase [Chloroflexota bacterium]|nr:sensor histidine kinase [Chloroflexota bacterium]